MIRHCFQSLFLILLLFFYSCSSSENKKVTLFSGTEMTINYQILVGQPLSSSDVIVISKIIRETFDEVNQTYNKWNPNSELSRLNSLKAGIVVPISSSLEQFLILVDQIVRLTDGLFDPTVEPLQAVWKKYLEKGEIPPNAEITLAAQAIGWNKIHFEKGLFYKNEDLTSLDLGGIAKGYCVDMIVNRLDQAGYSNCFVEWGGEIRALGQHPEGRPWNIFISHLGDPNPQKAIARLSLKDQAIATSGDYLQKWTLKNSVNPLKEITYFHVINPKTLQPCIRTLESVSSASVLASSCAFADGLATAAMMFSSIHEANQWMEGIKLQFPGLEFWLVSYQED